MASFVVFNGITRFIPGGITKINADALNPVTPGTNSIVALVGEADGGAPGSESGVVTIDDPSRARAIFGSGPLADAARIAFAPSGDPLVPGGASRVLCYKTNASTQSSLTIPGPRASNLVGYGGLTSAATGGTGTTLIDTSLSSTVNDQYNNMWLVLRPFTATCEVQQVTDYDSGTETFTVGAAWSSNPVAADVYHVYTNWVPFVKQINTGGSSTTTVAFAGTPFTVDAEIGRWVVIHQSATVSYLRQIVDNTASALTVSPALPATPGTGSFAQILPKAVTLTSRDYGVATNGITVDMAKIDADDEFSARVATLMFQGKEESSPDIGAFPFLKLLFKGAPVVTQDTVDNSPTASTTTVIQLVTGGLTPSAHVGRQVKIGDEYTMITANTASALTVSPALSAVPDQDDPVVIYDITGATAVVSGSAGAATGFTTTTGVVGADLTVSFTAGQTLRQLAEAINTNSNYVATVADGINPDTSLAADFDFGAVSKVSNILVSANLTDSGFTQNCMQVVNYFNDQSSLVTAVRADDGSFDGSFFPGDIDDPLAMAGGARGISQNLDFQAGFDALQKVRANSVVALIDEDLTNEGNGSTATVASVANQLKDHVIFCRGAGGSERGGFIGYNGTKAQIMALSKSLNDMDMAVVGQSPTMTDATGSLVEFGPRMLAVVAAGMRAGMSEVGEPLTNKILKAAALTQDASWDPLDTTDANDMIKAGVLFAQKLESGGVRWVRDLTTWVTDNNLAYSEGSVRDVVRYYAYGLRRALIDRYIGRKAAPATIANIRNTVVTFSELMRSSNIIVDSTDPATGATVRAYHNLKVTSSGDTVTVNVGIFPVPGINFILNEIFLQLPTQSA